MLNLVEDSKVGVRDQLFTPTPGPLESNTEDLLPQASDCQAARLHLGSEGLAIFTLGPICLLFLIRCWGFRGGQCPWSCGMRCVW